MQWRRKKKMTERVKVKRQKKFNESLGKGGKIDNSKNNDDLDDVIAAQLEKDKHTRKYPLKINKQTTIFVSKEKCNEQYAEEYRRKIEQFARAHE
jgi:hypothetical protein